MQQPILAENFKISGGICIFAENYILTRLLK